MRRSFALLVSLSAAVTFVADEPDLRVRSLVAGERTRSFVVQAPASADASYVAEAEGQTTKDVVRSAEPLADETEPPSGSGSAIKPDIGSRRRPVSGKSIPSVTPIRTEADNQSIAVTVRVAPGTGGGAPLYALWQSQPNPSHGSSLIRYSIGKPEQVSIVVYSVMGERIATLVNGHHEAGPHTVQWNGVDDRGNRVRSGIYFYRMTAGSFMRSKKLILER